MSISMPVFSCSAKRTAMACHPSSRRQGAPERTASFNIGPAPSERARARCCRAGANRVSNGSLRAGGKALCKAPCLRQGVDPGLQVGGHGVAMLRDELAGDHERPGILLSIHAARIVPLGWRHHSQPPGSMPNRCESAIPGMSFRPVQPVSDSPDASCPVDGMGSASLLRLRSGWPR